jgi:DNA modification methylase
MDLRIEHWTIDRLIPYVRNPRTHTAEQIAQVAGSITEFGFVNPILVGPDNVIIAGHARFAAAQKLGLPTVPVIVLRHLSDAQRRALVIADNRLALNAGWDEEMLRIELAALQDVDFNLDLTGFAEAELARLMAEQQALVGLTDEDAAPALPEVPVTATGDLWLLGNHKLLVGDATVQPDVERLMSAESADLVFTDPPYNVDYEGYTEEKLKIQSDRMSAGDYRAFLRSIFQAYRSLAKPGASLYVCHPSSSQREFQDAMEAAGFEIRCQVIWAKNTFAWGFGRYKFQHEPIFYTHVAGQSDAWYGDRSQSTLWHENKPAANRLHPTMKPVELIERALLNSSKAGDIVVDLFGGSGSTLVACERRGRKARLLEIDPKYADVIIRRYQEYTGRPAELEGRSFEEVARDRAKEAA